MANVAPFEILAARFNLYVGPYDVAIPDLSAGEPAGFTKIGRGGYRNITTDGFTASNPMSFEKFRSLGSAYPSKFFRTEADAMLRVTVADFRFEVLKLAFDDNDIIVSGAGPYTKKLGLTVSLNLPPMRVIAYSAEGSPYGNLGARLVLRRAVLTAPQEFNFRRSGPVVVQLQFEGMEEEGISDEEESVWFAEAMSATSAT